MLDLQCCSSHHFLGVLSFTSLWFLLSWWKVGLLFSWNNKISWKFFKCFCRYLYPCWEELHWVGFGSVQSLCAIFSVIFCIWLHSYNSLEYLETWFKFFKGLSYIHVYYPLFWGFKRFQCMFVSFDVQNSYFDRTFRWFAYVITFWE